MSGLSESLKAGPCGLKGGWWFRCVLFAAALTIGLSGCRQEPPPIKERRSGKEPVMRVKVAGPAQAVSFGINGAFTVFDSKRHPLAQGPYLPEGQVRPQGQSIQLGGATVAVSDFIDIVPNRNGDLRINQARYPGSLRLHRLGDGQLMAVNHVLVEEYLKGVIPGELPPRFQAETCKAQAIAARTYALYEKATRSGPSRQYDVTDGESSQVYKGLEGRTDRGNNAVDQTRGIVLTGSTRNGWRIFPAFFSSTCGGWTQGAQHLAAIDPEFRPLQGEVECKGCTISKYRRWDEMRMPLADLTQRVNEKLGKSFQRIVNVQVARRSRYGRAIQVKVTDVSGAAVLVPGEKFRLIAGPRVMRSTCCSLRVEGDELVMYDGQGFGHGVGMCQWGAEGMARQGHTAVEILLHYYPSANLVRAY